MHQFKESYNLMSTRSTKDKIIYEQKVTPRGQHYYIPYYIGKILGKGGFATCYEIKSQNNQNKYAVKIIQKESQHHTKHETVEKIKQEIALISSLNHPGIVKYIHDFEDNQNCYIILQLCTNGSLSDILKKRRYLTQPQIRYFIFQMIAIMKYIKQKNIIHREQQWGQFSIKLANYFLDQKFRLKLGDFGLATKNDQHFRSKRKMCGTPNYIAPEIIQKKVYSFEVDTWSTGVLIFTLAFGIPPFETKNCKQTYQKIKRCNYKFDGISKSISCSDDLKDFIKKILCLDPIKRLKIQDFIYHPFLSRYNIPQELEVTFPASAPSSSFLKVYSKIMKKRQGCSLKKQNSSKKQDTTKIEQKWPKVSYKDALYTQRYLQRNIIKETQYMPCLPAKREDQGLKEENQKVEAVYQTPKKMDKVEKIEVMGKVEKEEVKIQEKLKKQNEELEEKVQLQKHSKGRKKFCPNFSIQIENETQKKIHKLEKSIHQQQRKPQIDNQVLIPNLKQQLFPSQPPLPKLQNPPIDNQNNPIPPPPLQCNWTRPNLTLKLKHSNIKIKPSSFPQIKVIYWLNLTQKYGIVYILASHEIGFYFNDSSRMLLSSDQTIHYIFKKGQQTIHRQISKRQQNNLPESDKLHNKIQILLYYSTILSKKYPIKPNQCLLDSTTANLTPVHLKGFKLGNQVNIFKFSNNDIQFLFQDGKDMLLSFNNKTIFYQGKGMKVAEFLLRGKDDFEPDFDKKLHMAFTFYGKWLPKNEFGEMFTTKRGKRI